MNTIQKCVYGRKKNRSNPPVPEKKEIVISEEFKKEYKSLSEIKMLERMVFCGN